MTSLCVKFDGKHIDTFVINDSALPGVDLGAAPIFESLPRRTTAVSRRDGKIYFLPGNVSASDFNEQPAGLKAKTVWRNYSYLVAIPCAPNGRPVSVSIIVKLPSCSTR